MNQQKKERKKERKKSDIKGKSRKKLVWGWGKRKKTRLKADLGWYGGGVKRGG